MVFVRIISAAEQPFSTDVNHTRLTVSGCSAENLYAYSAVMGRGRLLTIWRQLADDRRKVVLFVVVVD